jgi:hypothetical protein
VATPDESPREEAGGLSEDLHSRRVGDRISYVGKPKNRVKYGRVEVDGRLTAYVYYSDAEDAVGYISLRSAGSRAANAGLAWSRLFRVLFERGLSPTAPGQPGGGLQIRFLTVDEDRTSTWIQLRESPASWEVTVFADETAQLAVWGKNFNFDREMSGVDYLLRLSDVDSNLALWFLDGEFVFGTGMRNDRPHAEVSSSDFEAVRKYAAWYMVSHWRYDKALISTLDERSTVPAKDYSVERIGSKVRLRSPDGWTLSFIDGGILAIAAASFSKVASLSTEEVCTLGQMPEPFPLP